MQGFIQIASLPTQLFQSNSLDTLSLVCDEAVLRQPEKEYLMKQHCVAEEGMTGEAARACYSSTFETIAYKPSTCWLQGVYLMKQHCHDEEGLTDEAARACNSSTFETIAY